MRFPPGQDAYASSYMAQVNYAKGSNGGWLNIEVACRLGCVLQIPGGSLRLPSSLTLSNQSHSTIKTHSHNIFQADDYKGRWDDASGSVSILHPENVLELVRVAVSPSKCDSPHTSFRQRLPLQAPLQAQLRSRDRKHVLPRFPENKWQW